MSRKRLEITGRTFNRLTALTPHPENRKLWLFRCTCGTEKYQFAAAVKFGATKSCGCLTAEVLAGRAKHGATAGGKQHPLWNLYCGMIARCSNPNHVRYASYGGKEVTVCQRWRDNFTNFLEDMGERPVGYSLDRIDPGGNYEPSNCRWATSKEQSLNTTRNVRLKLNGESLTVSEWANRLGVGARTLNRRRYLGWSDHDVLTTPIGGKKC